MSDIEREFQPGHILHNVIIGAFRAKGSTFQAWCETNEVSQATARNCTYGQNSGPKGRAMLDRIIDDAGRELIRVLYAQRMKAEAAKLAS